MSIPDDYLDKIDSLTKDLNLNGRSETIRNAIELLALESKLTKKITGKVNAILIITHLHSKNTSKISHTNQDLIKTHIHTHIKDEKCTDFFILEGDAEKIKNLSNNFHKDKKTILSKLIIL